jgi:hypothetical protein
LLQQFVVALGDAQDLIDRLDAVGRNRFFVEQSPESFCERSAKPLGLVKEGSCALRIPLGKSKQLGASFGRNDAGQKEKAKKFFPGGAEFVDEINGEAATDQDKRSWNVIHESTPQNRLVLGMSGDLCNNRLNVTKRLCIVTLICH